MMNFLSPFAEFAVRQTPMSPKTDQEDTSDAARRAGRIKAVL
jgi:hypothetical protein